MKIIKKFLPKSVLNLRHLFYAWWGSVKYHHPSEELFVIGVTGTSGKSTTVYFLRQLLEDVGFKVGSLTTIDFYIAGEQKMNDKKMTMLGKMQIQEYLRKMADKKCDIAIVETTSEGAVQHRHRFINYDMILLTNLYPEHIESHGSFENYKNAKLGVFRYIAGSKRKLKGTWELSAKGRISLWLRNWGDCVPKTAIVNKETKEKAEFLKLSFEVKKEFGDKSNIEAKNIIVDKDGLHFNVDERRYDVKMYGEHNIKNILAVIQIARCLQIPWNKIQNAVNKLKPAPGRIEFISEAEEHGFQVIVDYAFEPVALESLYKVVELLKPKRVIHVCGSTGGGRDKARREPIGQLVGKKADIFIVTDEDPYDEDPKEIMEAVTEGAVKAGKEEGKDLFKILDRKAAIEKALGLAKVGDLILITGKGSEQAMCVAGGEMIEWDDRAIVRDVIQKF